MKDKLSAIRPRRTLIALSAVVAFAVVIWLIQGAAKHYAVRQLTEAVGEHTEHLYDLSVGDVSLHLFSGEIHIEDIRMIPRRVALDSLAAIGRQPGIICTVRSGDAYIRLRRPLYNMMRHRLDIKSIVVDAPEFSVFSNEKDTLSAEQPRKFRSPFKSISVRTIDIRGGRLSYSKARSTDTLQASLQNVDIHLERLHIDSLFDPGVMPDVGKLSIITGNMSLSPAGEGLAIEVKALRGDLHGPLAIDSLRILPQYGQREFPLRTTGKDWMRLTVGSLTLADADWNALFDGKGLHADSLGARGIVIESYKNRQIAVPQREKPLFHRMLQQIPLPFAIRVANIEQSTAIYHELPVGGNTAGLLFIDDISARFDSLTNIPGHNDHIDIATHARMMGSGVMALDLELPVDPGDDQFLISGSLSSMPLDAFEPMMEPLGHMGVHSGRVTKLYLTMEGDVHDGAINMRFGYDSLSIDVLNKQGMRSWAGSAAVNALVIKDSNPLPGKEMREVHASAVRDPYRSNFNYWWRIVFAATKESVGLSEQLQEEMIDVQNLFKKMKQRREERRRERGK